MSENRFEVFSTFIARINKSLQKIKAKAMEPFGLKSSHVMCLFFLQQSESGLTIAEISELSELDKGAVSRAMSELQKLGYVSRPGAEDSKKYRVKLSLTETGHALSEKMNLIIDDSVKKAGLGLSEENRRVFYSGLALICSNLQALAESYGE